MRVFGGLYKRVLSWSRHPRAPHYLAGLSFAESSFFPIPPDVMLAPMALAKPASAMRFAMITTAASVLGGVAGYFIGVFALEQVLPLLHDLGYHEKYLTVREWFGRWGFWAVFVAGFSPVPYKLFTITAGAVGMSLPLFVLASFIARGARFYLIAGLIRAGGPELEAKLLRNIDRLAVLTVVAAVLGYWFLKR